MRCFSHFVLVGFLTAPGAVLAATVAPAEFPLEPVSFILPVPDQAQQFPSMTPTDDTEPAVVHVVPIPASAMMMLGALGCLVLLRRRITAPPDLIRTDPASPTPAR